MCIPLKEQIPYIAIKLSMQLLLIGIPVFLLAQTIPLTEDNWQVINNDDNKRLDFKTIDYKGKKAIHLQRHQIFGKNASNELGIYCSVIFL